MRPRPAVETLQHSVFARELATVAIFLCSLDCFVLPLARPRNDSTNDTTNDSTVEIKYNADAGVARVNTTHSYQTPKW
ncbi:MAG: hypothetical protein LBG59_04790 [Candidatus Peribacteria bacterium]|nr:hypothetical protein [Candidatus Peribacteria bacterium]